MAGKFNWTRFADVNLSDEFFNSLKNDYIEFTEWFERKAREGEQALVFQENNAIGAFIYLKDEKEEIQLQDKTLPVKHRMKIGTLKLSEKIRNIRLGEGAIGVALWRWRESCAEEIYLTVFESHTQLIALIEKFGFIMSGKNKRGECVYIKNRKQINYENPYKSFPFINPKFSRAGLLPIEEQFHDKLFPYSELQGNVSALEEAVAGNGISKIYIATPSSGISYQIGEPLCIYRKYNGPNKGFRSVVTSYATVTHIEVIKNQGYANCSVEKFIELCGNKTIFDEQILSGVYNRPNVVMIEMVYNGYFGAGNNVNFFALKNNNLFEDYPYNIQYTKEQFETILKIGRVNVDTIYD